MKLTEQISEINNVADLDTNIDNLPPIEAIKANIGLISLILKLIMVFTGPRADARIKQILKALEGL